MTIEEAVERTIDDCIREGILVDILTKFKAEVKKMSIFEYNARLHEETLKKEGYEDGRERGREEGREEGREQGELKTLCSLIDDGILTIEQASDRMGMEPEEFLKKREEILLLV